jgi:hypothetical protein
MTFFLRYVNPVLALAVLVICLISACTQESGGALSYVGFFKGPIPTYFLAKGIFCSTALFLLGKLVEQKLAAERPAGRASAAGPGIGGGVRGQEKTGSGSETMDAGEA